MLIWTVYAEGLLYAGGVTHITSLIGDTFASSINEQTEVRSPLLGSREAGLWP